MGLRAFLAALVVVSASCGGAIASPTPDASTSDAGSSDPPAIDPPLGPNDVLGTIYDSMGTRMSAVTVQFDSSLVPVDAWGRFVVRNAPSTYDVFVDDGHAVTGDVGESARLLSLTIAGPYNAGVIHIAYGPPSVAGGQFAAFATLANGLPWNIVSGVSDPQVPMGNDGPEDLTFYAFEYVQPNPNAPPTSFVRWAKGTVQLVANGTATWTPQFQPVTDMTTFTATPTVAAGMTLYEAYVQFSPNGGVGSSPSTPWAYLVVPQSWSFALPRVDQPIWTISYEAYTTGQQGSIGGASSNVIIAVPGDGAAPPDPVVPPPPAFVTPADGASFGPGSVFTWSGGSETCTLQMTTQNPYTELDFRTTARTITFPDLTPLNRNPLPGANVLWGVDCSGPAPDASDAGVGGITYTQRTTLRSAVAK